ATAIIAGVKQTVQYFVMRLCYSRRTFVMMFPSQNQESFLYAHVQAFHHFGGVPARISYDNLATAVKLAFDKKDKRKKRIENRTFVAFRSHYLFESHFCTPAAGWEKGQVEHHQLCRHLPGSRAFALPSRKPGKTRIGMAALLEASSGYSRIVS